MLGKAAKKTLRKADSKLSAARAAREQRFRDRVAGTTHPRTGVRYDADGFPMFESRHNYDLPPGQNRPDVSDTTQMRQATENLRQHLQDNPGDQRLYTPEQLAAIEAGSPRIPGYTWHHHQDGVTMQLVDRADHGGTGHYGGRAATGGRS